MYYLKFKFKHIKLTNFRFKMSMLYKFEAFKFNQLIFKVSGLMFLLKQRIYKILNQKINSLSFYFKKSTINRVHILEDRIKFQNSLVTEE